MRRRLTSRVEDLRGAEHGFTLLELLIAIVVLSILMATATQYYFHHRRKAWEAQVRASVRNMAGAENYYVYNEGSPAYTKDLDNLYLAGYRWNESSVRPYVALATTQTFCIQVHSSHDPTIVWHFSSEVGHPESGPATPEDCGDPEVLGTYIAGLPPASAGRDGVLSSPSEGVSVAGMGWDESSGGDSSVEEGEFDPDGGPATGTGDDDDDPTTTGSTPGYGTGATTSGTVRGDTTGATTPTGCSRGGTGSGSSSSTDHPSGKDRDTENGGSGDQGSSGSDPDGDENGGADKTGEGGGANTTDQDNNNGSGNDTDFEDDNRAPDRNGSPTADSRC